MSKIKLVVIDVLVVALVGMFLVFASTVNVADAAATKDGGPEKDTTTVRHEVGITPETTEAITLALQKFGNTTYELSKQAMSSLTKNGGDFLTFYYKMTVQYIMIRGVCYALFGLVMVVAVMKLWRLTYAKAIAENDYLTSMDFPGWHVLCGIEVTLGFIGLIMFCHGLFDVGTAHYQAVQLIAQQFVQLIPR